MVRRNLAGALPGRPILFEPVPPSVRTPPDRIEAYERRIASVLTEHARVDAFVVPELVSENHNGEPHYRSGDVRRFASRVAALSGCEAILNKVVAHVRSLDELERWYATGVDAAIRHVMFIGGTSRYIPYPGPSVADANRGLAPLVARHDGRIGNVVIPHREHEGYRMLTKTQAGAAFFTTQILFDPSPIDQLLDEYDRLCRAYEVRPATVLLSVAPVTDEDDLEFVRWLGAEIPDRVEHGLLSEDGSASLAVAVETWRAVAARAAARGGRVPLGANVEVVTPRHFGAAVELLSALERELGPGGAGP